MDLLRTVPYKHQAHVIELSKDREFFALFMEQGTGKTPVGIATWTHLFRTGRITGVVIVAPNGVHDNWTRLEIPKHQHPEIGDCNIAIWHGGAGKKSRLRFDWVANLSPTSSLAILATNVESLRTESFWKSIKGFLKRRFLLIVDESTIVKNPKAAQSKNCLHLARQAAYVRIMTGTPITQSPLDLWMQCRILSPNALPYTSYTAFKHEFAIEETIFMGNRAFNKIVGYKNQDLLARAIEPFSYRVLKKDCLDLPPKVLQTRFIELTPEQKRIYKQLAEECLASLGSDGMVSVTTVITMMLRLHQVVLGYVPSDNEQMVQIEHNRISALTELLEENPVKTIIFCRFLEDVSQVCKSFQSGKFVTYTGLDSNKARAEAVDSFQNDPDCRWFVATSAASKGLTLTAAEHVIYYSQGYSMEIRSQSEDRAHRSGQTRTVVYTDLCSAGTVEDSIVQALQSKKELAAGVMDRLQIQKLLKLDE